MKIGFASSGPEDVHALAVLVGKDRALTPPAEAADQATGGQLRRALAASRFDGDAAQLAEVLAPYGMTASRLLAVGTGEPGQADRGLYAKIGDALAARLLSSGEVHLVVDVAGTERSAQLTPAASIAPGGRSAERCVGTGGC